MHYLHNRSLVVALSGGVDSVVLLHYVCQNAQLFKSIRAIHINHHLNEKADAWHEFCKSLCAHYKIDYKCLDVYLESAKNLEKCARDKRYKALYRSLKYDELLCTAHHQNDQAETHLLQLLRGCGVAGLASMPLIKDKHARPLLEWKKLDIVNYANEQKLSWVEDDSNKNTHFKRNFLRHKIIPLLTKNFPNVVNSLSRSAAHQGEALTLLRELAQQDINHYCLIDEKNRLLVSNLAKLELHRLHNVLRYYFHLQKMLMPSQKILSQMTRQLLHASIDAKVLIRWSNHCVRRYNDRVYCDKENIKDDTECLLTAHLAADITLIVAYNKPIKRVILVGKKHSQSLKKLYQEKHIPPWLRPKLAMYYKDDVLIAIERLGMLSQK